MVANIMCCKCIFRYIFIKSINIHLSKIACDSKCETCNILGILCLKCKRGYFLDTLNNCVTSCLLGYKDPITRTC